MRRRQATQQQETVTLVAPQAATPSVVATATDLEGSMLVPDDATSTPSSETTTASVHFDLSFTAASQPYSNTAAATSITSRTTASDGAVMTTVYVTSGLIQPTQSPAPANTLSSGASAGIGVGIGLGALLLSVVGLLLWRRRGKWRKRSRKERENAAASSETAELPGEGKERAELEVKDVTHEVGETKEPRELHAQAIRAELEGDWERREILVSTIK